MNTFYKTTTTSRRGLRHTVRIGQLIDICLATAWAAMIPGLMWLGVAGGF